MFDLIPKLLRSPIFFAIAILVVIMTPSVIYKTGESERLAISVAVGMDYIEENDENEKLQLSLMFLTPQASSDLEKNYTVTTVSGRNVTNCLDTIEAKIGKKVGLSHCQVIVLSESLAKHGPLEYLDSFTRTNDLTTNALLICSDNPKKLIEAQIAESSSISISLTNILDYITEHTFTKQMNLEKFYAEYFEESSISYIPFISPKGSSEESSPSGQSGGSTGGASDSNSGSSNEQSINDQSASGGGDPSASSPSGSSSGSSKGGASTDASTVSAQGPTEEEIEFNYTVGVFNQGKLVTKLNEEQGNIFNMLYSKKGKSIIQLNNFVSHYTQEADLSLTVEDKKSNISYNFVNGYPVVNVDLSLFCKVSEINTNEYYLDTVSVVNGQITENLRKAITKKVEQNFANAINYSKENNIDLFYAGKYFYRLCTKEWEEYKLNCDANSNYLQNILFILNLKVIEWS